jgi:hypothetical protein
MKPVHATMSAACSPAELFPWVDDLARYPAWLDLVQRAEPIEPQGWSVVLTARLGPLRRSKQLTMVRTAHEPTVRARFERREPDGRQHAAWILEAEVSATEDGSRLTMTMHYDGQWWGPLIERVLAEQIDAARPRLAALVAG